MTGKLTISYWWKGIGFKKIPITWEAELAKAAQDKAIEMFRAGYTSGELFWTTRLNNGGKQIPKDGWACSGWWEIE